MSFNNLKAEMARASITQADVARVLGMTRDNTNLKINERVPFTIDEAKKVRRSFFADLSLDYLFVSDSDEPGEREASDER